MRKNVKKNLVDSIAVILLIVGCATVFVSCFITSIYAALIFGVGLVTIFIALLIEVVIVDVLKERF